MQSVDYARESESVAAPQYQTFSSNGFDLEATEDVVLGPGERALVPTGLYFDLAYPDCLLVTPRSGLALEHGVTVLNGPGLVDSDYRGEVKVILANLGTETVMFPAGTRIAQAVILPIEQRKFREVSEVSSTKRGACGFGSTGR